MADDYYIVKAGRLVPAKCMPSATLEPTTGDPVPDGQPTTGDPVPDLVIYPPTLPTVGDDGLVSTTPDVARTGWQCPLCLRVYAPHVDQCRKC